MSALPSVVLGYIGLYVLSALVKNIFNLNTGLTALTGGILLSFMAIPTMVSISDDAIRALDPSYKEASLAMGANKLEIVVNNTSSSVSWNFCRDNAWVWRNNR